MRFALLLSTALVMMTLPAMADPAAHQGGAATGANVAQGETVDERIQNLHQELKITPDEEKKWNDVAQTMRENAGKMEQMVSDRKSMDPNTMTAKDDLKTYQEFAQSHVDGLKNLRASFDSLYDSMPADQQKVADEVFRNAKHNQ
jgi:protein CpxP